MYQLVTFATAFEVFAPKGAKVETLDGKRLKFSSKTVDFIHNLAIDALVSPANAQTPFSPNQCLYGHKRSHNAANIQYRRAITSWFTLKHMHQCALSGSLLLFDCSHQLAVSITLFLQHLRRLILRS